MKGNNVIHYDENGGKNDKDILVTNASRLISSTGISTSIFSYSALCAKQMFDKFTKECPDLAAEACFSGIKREDIPSYIYNKKIIKGLEDNFTELLGKYHFLTSENNIFHGKRFQLVVAFGQPLSFGLLGKNNPKISVSLLFFRADGEEDISFRIDTYAHSLDNLYITLNRSDRLHKLFYRKTENIFRHLRNYNTRRQAGYRNVDVNNSREYEVASKHHWATEYFDSDEPYNEPYEPTPFDIGDIIKDNGSL